MWLVGNGEIYNHEDVRQTLDGRLFSTRSDNEVALHLIDDRGPAAIDQLSGMYALLGADADGRFIAARDPVGIKPLYWAGARARSASPPRCGPSTRPGCRWSRSSPRATTGRPRTGPGPLRARRCPRATT